MGVVDPPRDGAGPEAIADLLAARPRGLTLAQLMRSVSPRRSTLALLTDLTSLQSRGLVRFSGATWRWIGPAPRSAIREPPPPEVLRIGEATAAKDPAPSASRSQSRWGEFRRLCLYYAEYARREERATVRVSANRENLDFVQLTCGIDWSRLEAGGSIRIRLPEEGRPFASLGTSGNRLPNWYLGCPMSSGMRVEMLPTVGRRSNRF